MNKLVYIIGSGGLAREIYQLVVESYRDLSPVLVCESEKNIIDNYECILESEYKSIRMVKKTVLGVGKPNVRNKILKMLSNLENVEYINIFHYTAKIPVGMKMGVGNVFCQASIFTTDVHIGDHNLINIGAVIAHDANVGSNNVFNPSSSISGNITIGNNNLIGVRAAILENLTVGDNNILGGGAVLTKSIQNDGVYAGVPAKLLKANGLMT